MVTGVLKAGRVSWLDRGRSSSIFCLLIRQHLAFFVLLSAMGMHDLIHLLESDAVARPLSVSHLREITSI